MTRKSALSCALSAAFVACGLMSGAVQASETLNKIQQTGKIRVAYRESSMPFSYLAGPGKPIGFSVDMTQDVINAVKTKVGKPNLEVEWVAVTTQNRIPLLRNGTIDFECGSTVNNSARAKEVDFGVNFFYTGTRLLVKKASGVKNYADLKGKSVGSTTGAVNYQVLRKYSMDNALDINFLLAKDHVDGFLQLESDRTTAFVLDDILLFSLKAGAKNPNDFDVVGDTLQVEPYACMVRKGDTEMKQILDGVIVGMMNSGEFERRYDRWFMKAVPPNNLSLAVPMSQELKANLKEHSDKPAR
ncbi:transporter substrate-binding domain-containing protein [Diaphorobacter sp.]|uniref:transporter substrate-binding domain-containing protein n=1 Tax=Diaphorobacter sp. TaxID=1934310 RepID=UPI0039184448